MKCFRNLGIQDFTLKLNNRKILAGIAEVIGAPGKEGALSVAIDKLDKIGRDKVWTNCGSGVFRTQPLTKLEPPLFTFQ